MGPCAHAYEARGVGKLCPIDARWTLEAVRLSEPHTEERDSLTAVVIKPPDRNPPSQPRPAR